MLLWTKNRQQLWAKIADTVVAYDPQGQLRAATAPSPLSPEVQPAAVPAVVPATVPEAPSSQ